jgi:hypothetical protein
MHLFLCELTGMHSGAPATAAIAAARSSLPPKTFFAFPKTLCFDGPGQDFARKPSEEGAVALSGETGWQADTAAAENACTIKLTIKTVLMAMPLETALLLVGALPAASGSAAVAATHWIEVPSPSASPFSV